MFPSLPFDIYKLIILSEGGGGLLIILSEGGRGLLIILSEGWGGDYFGLKAFTWLFANVRPKEREEKKLRQK